MNSTKAIGTQPREPFLLCLTGRVDLLLHFSSGSLFLSLPGAVRLV
jgi:hypothetical protein